MPSDSGLRMLQAQSRLAALRLIEWIQPLPLVYIRISGHYQCDLRGLRYRGSPEERRENKRIRRPTLHKFWMKRSFQQGRTPVCLLHTWMS
jgi:hypothetical protein